MKTKICHAPAVSYLTAEKNWTDYNGLINLTKLMLVFANLRLFIENMSVFGLQVKVFPPLFEMMKDPITWTNSWILVEIQILAMVSLHIERLIARDILSYSQGANRVNFFLKIVEILEHFAPKIRIILNSQ
jgi:hypothetical protein